MCIPLFLRTIIDNLSENPPNLQVNLMRVEILSCGHCIQVEAFSKGNGSPRKVSFPSSVVLIDHPRHGVILFDSGYTDAFIEETRHFPERLYALTTPVTISNDTSAKSQLLRRGIAPEDVRHVVISHFHADHIAGLRDFPLAKFHFSDNAYLPFKKWSRLRQVSQGYLRGLLPDDFGDRSVTYDFSLPLRSINLDYFEQAHFLLGEESLALIPLSGHATGHIGLLVRESGNSAFFVGDACWHRDNFIRNSPPMRLAVSWLGDYQQYHSTLTSLKYLRYAHPEIQIIPCHCSDSHQSFIWQDTSTPTPNVIPTSPIQYQVEGRQPSL